MRQTSIKQKWFILILGIGISLIFLAQTSLAAEGDLTWSQVSTSSLGGDVTSDVAIDSTGIYIVGLNYASSSGLDEQWKIQKRSLTDGALIWSQVSNPSTGVDEARGVAVDSTGVYIVGPDIALGTFQWRIEKRSLTDGALIWSQVSNPSGGNDAAYRIAIDSTGIYIIGSDYTPGPNPQWRIEKRSLTNGALTWHQEIDPSTGYDAPNDITIDSTGIYIVGHYDPIFSPYYGRIEKRSLTDGALIWSVANAVNNSAANRVTIDSTGIYTVGMDASSSAQWRIEKRSLTDGALTWSVANSASSSAASDITIDSTGIYIVGSDYATSDGDIEWRIEKRSLTNGALIWSQVSNLSTGVNGVDTAIGVTIDSTGIYIVGVDSVIGGYEWRIEKRLTIPTVTYVDCGLRMYSGTASITIACEPSGTLTSPLRIRKGTTTYGIVLVATTDSNASAIRIYTSSGVKALRKY